MEISTQHNLNLGKVLVLDGSHSYLLIICVSDRTTSKDSGSYRCVATNEFNNTVFTSNASVDVTVKGLW